MPVRTANGQRVVPKTGVLQRNRHLTYEDLLGGCVQHGGHGLAGKQEGRKAITDRFSGKLRMAWNALTLSRAPGVRLLRVGEASDG